ncbi:membrane protein insertion efficiency factor YidD [Campylobacter sp. 19-13652]|uniref:membrane protein insertion efficiency factor YidD n=1 Tax=Campylobacter sp. 19-13652 TaxID=2840180 RepID=UPI001C855303|nr:membrane protein insertion efficiency factor YidD [Campylobacter sp. 19-13652]
MKKWLVGLIKFYQLYISKLLPRSCRYYPTCSEYAMWQFKFNSPFRAFWATLLRLLRCNQLFSGGVDYPVVSKPFNYFVYQKKHISFWFIPLKNNKFQIIKAIC